MQITRTAVAAAAAGLLLTAGAAVGITLAVTDDSPGALENPVLETNPTPDYDQFHTMVSGLGSFRYDGANRAQTAVLADVACDLMAVNPGTSTTDLARKTQVAGVTLSDSVLVLDFARRYVCPVSSTRS